MKRKEADPGLAIAWTGTKEVDNGIERAAQFRFWGWMIWKAEKPRQWGNFKFILVYFRHSVVTYPYNLFVTEFCIVVKTENFAFDLYFLN